MELPQRTQNHNNENRIVTYANNDIDNYINNEYNFEIELSCCQKVLIIFLNILTGGLGTILVPFLNKKRKKKTMIIAGILIGLFQILHFLHFFSVLTGVKFIDDFYSYISDDKFLEIFFQVNYDDIEDISEENDIYIYNINKKDDSSLFEFIIESLELNISEILIKKKRIKILKTLFTFISGMSYCNSLFISLINFISEKPDSPNNKLGIQILLYNLFNPGVGIILSCIYLFPSCASSNIRGIVLSLLGIFIGILIMLCPISLCIGTYLTKLTNKTITIFPMKITFIFLGTFGIILSFFLSGINKKTIIESVNISVNPLDLIIGCGSNFVHLVSEFGWISFFRLLLNMVIPGLGTLTLLKKYGFTFGIIFASILQFFGGAFFFISIKILKTGKCDVTLYEKIFFKVLKTTQDGDPYNYEYFTKVFDYFYTMGLCFYFSGIITILILDYFSEIKVFQAKITEIAYAALSLFTGGIGFALFIDAFLMEYPCLINCDSDCGKIIGVLLFPIGGFISFGGFLYDLFFWKIASKACRIIFPICYLICFSYVRIISILKWRL